MLDGLARRAIDPAMNHAGAWLARRGVEADTITLVGLGFGLLSAAILAIGAPGAMALVPLLFSRLMDGLDGAVARATQKTDFGGLLDIVSDFAFYGAIPLAFVLRDTGENGVAGAFLLFCFYVNGASFLAYATMAAKNGMETTDRGEKSLYFTAGLLEGTETILFFVLICLFPVLFPFLAWIFGLLCLVTAAARVMLAWQTFDLD
ncbi:CDP-alcohol phosphatidyltransferase family protein [Aliigemmobacter aestuarii]|uniref:CDP-alcohol phosphatidyltransferase family protein n=1 Tax=Aliigemmobacter aestuarii TaxID=1445661 RepID=A0A4S3MTC1_9RHOB|nr:CDP-alcohol phosphatidyltransferase family protein [Gemmobacter aestuarii]THD84741.1 CDP-alcohol phosphatidyltransferase family protein [Gemmobacter aestuarii]